jgi:hypothetical protein
MQISVEVDIRNATRGLLLLQKDINRAAVAALNKTGTTARAVAAREISRETSLPVNEVRKRVPLVKANGYTLQAQIKAEPYAPNLIRYSKDTRAAARKRGGVRAKAWRQAKLYKGTFIGNQGRTVFKRVGESRLPIKAVYGPSVPREFIRDHTLTAIQTTVGQRFPLEFDRALGALLRWR